MTKKKEAPKKDIKAELAKNKSVSIFVEGYEKIESADKKMREELSPMFRKISVDMYESVHVYKVFKSGRALADAMKKNHAVVARYINAGEFLRKTNDAELAKHDLFAYDIKNALRKVKKDLAPKNAKQLKKVKNKKATKKVVAITEEQAIETLKTILRNCDNAERVANLRTKLVTLSQIPNEPTERKARKEKGFMTTVAKVPVKATK